MHVQSLLAPGKILLTLPMLRLLSSKAQWWHDAKIFENHLNPFMFVFIGILSLTALRWVSMCQGFSVIFLRFLHHFILAKLATSNIRVKHTPITLSYLQKGGEGGYFVPNRILIHGKTSLKLSSNIFSVYDKFDCYSLKLRRSRRQLSCGSPGMNELKFLHKQCCLWDLARIFMTGCPNWDFKNLGCPKSLIEKVKIITLI